MGAAVQTTSLFQPSRESVPTAVSESQCLSIRLTSLDHTENDRYSQVEDALANRRGVDLIEEQQRVVDRQAQIEFFTTHFSDVTASSNSSEEASKSGNSSHDRERRERREPWAGWEVDKWWVGQWRMHRGVRMKEAQ